MSSSENTNYSGVMRVDPEKCTLCYACIRECPTKAIEAPLNIQHVEIVDERCTGCGSCYIICPTKAIDYASDMATVNELLESGEELAAVTDPAIAGEFADISDLRSFVGEIRALGFSYVNDASFGADLIARRNAEILKDFKGKYLVNSKCPAVNLYITKFFPNLTDNLVPLVTPLNASAAICRKKYPGARVVFITPCLSQKASDPVLDDEYKPDFILSFSELRQMFRDKQLTENTVEFSDFDQPTGMKGGLFPIRGGFMQSIGEVEDLLLSDFISGSGRKNMIDVISEFADGKSIKKHLDIFYCKGCIMGPGMSTQESRYKRRTYVTDFVSRRIEAVNEEQWKEDIRSYEEINLSRVFKPDDQRLEEPDAGIVDDILRSIGKGDGEYDDRGCASCGYKSCREFAVAVAQGLARVDMCNSYGSKNRQRYINSLQQSNEKLAKTKSALEESEKKAREEKEVVKALYETITAVMHRIPSAVLVVDRDLKVVEANQVLIDLLGDDAKAIHEIIPGLKGADVKSLMPQNIHQYFSYVSESNEELINKDVKIGDQILNISVFPVHKGRIIAAIIRDMSTPSVQKEETVKRIVEAIDKNLEMVQKIGFLLGEGAADTERMLNSIIQSFESGKSDQ